MSKTKIKYLEGIDNIARAVGSGINGMNIDDERTIINTPFGSYACRTSEFNSLSDKRYSSPGLAAETGLGLSNKSYKDRLPI